MRRPAPELRVPGPIDPAELREEIRRVLHEPPLRPWCVHRLYETLVARRQHGDRDDLLLVPEKAADQLFHEGAALREYVSAAPIGVHCQDSLYWAVDAGKRRLAEFGPEYESPTVMRRLGSHIRCSGL